MCAEVCQRWIAFEQALNTSVDMKNAGPAGIKRVGSTVSTLWQVYTGGWLQMEMLASTCEDLFRKSQL